MRVGLIVWVLAACGSTAAPPSAIANRDEGAPSAAALAREAERLLDASTPIDYRRPMLDAPVDRTKAIAQLVAACRAGDHRSCWIADVLHLPDAADRADVARLIRSACLANDVMSCRALSAPATDSAIPGWRGRAGCDSPADCDMAALRRECVEGFPASCASLALAAPDGDALRIRQVELLREGCRAGVLIECWQLTLAGAREDALLGYRQQCRFMLSNCVDVATRLNDLTAQRDLLEHDCQYGEREQSCAYLAHDYASGRYVEPVPGRAGALGAWISEARHRR